MKKLTYLSLIAFIIILVVIFFVDRGVGQDLYYFTYLPIVVKPLPTNTPTSTPTSIPTPFPTPIPTLDHTKTSKGKGTYLVGSEVAIGMWRNNGKDCWAYTENILGDLLELESGPWSIIRIKPDAYTVKFVDYPGVCVWSYIDTSWIPAPSTSPFDPKSEGTFIVGSEIHTGHWRNNGDCYAYTEDIDGNLLELSYGIGSILLVESNAYFAKFIDYPDVCIWFYID